VGHAEFRGCFEWNAVEFHLGQLHRACLRHQWMRENSGLHAGGLLSCHQHHACHALKGGCRYSVFANTHAWQWGRTLYLGTYRRNLSSRLVV
jgi:hypothetical protein